MSETKRLLREHLNTLQNQQSEIRTLSAPLRAERDRIKNEAFERTRALDAQIKEIEAPLLQVDTDLAAVAKGLGGRTMNERSKS